MNWVTEFQSLDKEHLALITANFHSRKIITEIDALLSRSLFAKLGDWMVYNGYEDRLITIGEFYEDQGSIYVLFDTAYFKLADARRYLNNCVEKMRQDQYR